MKSFKFFIENYHRLTDEEQNHVHEYTKDSYDLNLHHFDYHTNKPYKDAVDTPGDVEHNKYNSLYKAQTKHLDSAINKSHLDDHTTVHSGVSFRPNKEASKHPDRHIHLPAYTSTSKSEEIAQRFTRGHKAEDGSLHAHILHIDVAPHHKALDIGENSHNYDEKEVLLPRHTTLKIAEHPHKITKVEHPYNGSSLNIHHWKAEIVHQGQE